MKELISVIIPVYNVETYLERCLDTVVNQTYTNLEIICINDGSTDDSLGICKKYAARDERIRIIDQENRGLAYVRNKGIESATGEYLSFIDSDDYVDINYIEEMYNIIKKHNVDMAVANVIYEKDNMESYSLLKHEYDKEHILNKNEIMSEYLNTEGGIGNYIVNKLYTRKVLEGVYFPESKLFEDAFTMFKILNNVETVCITNNGRYHYCLRDDSITGLYNPAESDNFDLIDSNISKTEYVCQNFPEYADRAFHHLFIAYMGIFYKVIPVYSEKKDVMIKYFSIVRNIKKKNNVKFLDKKDKFIYTLLCINPKLYIKIYGIFRK